MTHIEVFDPASAQPLYQVGEVTPEREQVAAWGAMHNGGQSCTSVGRLCLQELQVEFIRPIMASKYRERRVVKYSRQLVLVMNRFARLMKPLLPTFTSELFLQPALIVADNVDEKLLPACFHTVQLNRLTQNDDIGIIPSTEILA